jgi:hypothetical protein
MNVGEQAHNCAARSFDFRLTRNEKVAEGGRSDYINLVDKSLIMQQNSEPIKIGVDTRWTDLDVLLSQDEGDAEHREYSLPQARIVSFIR